MPEPPVAADVDQPLDVHRDLAAQVALHPVVVLDLAAQLLHVGLREVLDPDIGVDARGRQNLLRRGKADAEDIGQRNFNALLARDVHT